MALAAISCRPPSLPHTTPGLLLILSSLPPLSPTCPSTIPLHRGSDSPIATPPRNLHQDLRGSVTLLFLLLGFRCCSCRKINFLDRSSFLKHFDCLLGQECEILIFSRLLVLRCRFRFQNGKKKSLFWFPWIYLWFNSLCYLYFSLRMPGLEKHRLKEL